MIRARLAYKCVHDFVGCVLTPSYFPLHRGLDQTIQPSLFLAKCFHRPSLYTSDCFGGSLCNTLNKGDYLCPILSHPPSPVLLFWAAFAAYNRPCFLGCHRWIVDHHKRRRTTKGATREKDRTTNPVPISGLGDRSITPAFCLPVTAGVAVPWQRKIYEMTRVLWAQLGVWAHPITPVSK